MSAAKQPTAPAAEPESAQSRKFRAKVLATADAILAHRGQHGIYGELTVKFSQQNGELTGARIVDETILKPGD